jgi:hypothetical protein
LKGEANLHQSPIGNLQFLPPPFVTIASKQIRSSVHSSGRTRSPSGPLDLMVLRHQYCDVEGECAGSPCPNASGENQFFDRRWRQRSGSACFASSSPGRAKRRIGARGSSVTSGEDLAERVFELDAREANLVGVLGEGTRALNRGLRGATRQLR